MNLKLSTEERACLAREAAAGIELNDQYSCIALGGELRKYLRAREGIESENYEGPTYEVSEKERGKYSDVFSDGSSSCWLMGRIEYEDQQDIRVMTLCMYAAMIETGDA